MRRTKDLCAGKPLLFLYVTRGGGNRGRLDNDDLDDDCTVPYYFAVVAGGNREKDIDMMVRSLSLSG